MATEDVTSASPVAPKSELTQDGFTPSSASSPGESELPSASTENPVDPPPPPKRKGGRKPIYATSEERKQRNRQAQAAFRERRTEYIKQLETTIQHRDETLQNLQQSHRTAADECLMLRYKNSLLERILLEKGIDVEGELRLKGSPHLRPMRHGITGQVSTMQKAMLNRQQNARQRPAVAPIQTSTPPSQQSSPSALRSPGFPMPNDMVSPNQDPQRPTSRLTAHQSQPQPQPQEHHSRQLSQVSPSHFAQQPRTHFRTPSTTPQSQSFPQPVRPATANVVMQNNYYPTGFQKHYDQLDQEFDAQPDLMDDGNGEGDEVDTESYIPNFRLPPTGGHLGMNMQMSPSTTASAVSESGGGGAGSGGGIGVPFEYDPMLDADPFGLSASMHFPNPYSFQHGQHRR